MNALKSACCSVGSNVKAVFTDKVKFAKVVTALAMTAFAGASVYAFYIGADFTFKAVVLAGFALSFILNRAFNAYQGKKEMKPNNDELTVAQRVDRIKCDADAIAQQVNAEKISKEKLDQLKAEKTALAKQHEEQVKLLIQKHANNMDQLREELSHMNSQLAQKADISKEDLAVLRQEKDDYKQQIADIRDEFDKLEKEKNELHKEYKDLDAEMKRVRGKINRSKSKKELKKTPDQQPGTNEAAAMAGSDKAA